MSVIDDKKNRAVILTSCISRVITQWPVKGNRVVPFLSVKKSAVLPVN